MGLLKHKGKRDFSLSENLRGILDSPGILFVQTTQDI